MHLKAPESAGLCTARLEFDHLRHPGSENLATTEGFCRALLSLLRVVERGLVWGGVPCSSFCWISTGSHGRSSEEPLGRDTAWVRLHNLIACRFMILCAVAASRHVHWGIENPRQSQLVHFPYLRWLVTLVHDIYKERGEGFTTWSHGFNFEYVHAGNGLGGTLHCQLRWMSQFGHWCCKPSLAVGSMLLG